MKLHEKIKALRKKKGISQQQLSNAVGIHITHVSRLENGHFQPSLDVLKSLVKLFEVSADYLLNDDADNYNVKIKDKNLADRIRLLDGLEDDEREALITVIDVMLTKQKMKQLLYKAKEEPVVKESVLV